MHRLVRLLPVLLLPTSPGPGSAAEPPFALVQEAGVDWLRTPGGQRFFSLGVCVLTPGQAEETYDPENPAYAWWRQSATREDWAHVTLDRLSAWKFTTAGAWADLETLAPTPGRLRAFTPVLHMGSTAGAPWWDMWDPKVIRRIDETARDQILHLRDDPRLLGYYSDNELGWWNATLFKMTLEQPPTSGQRQRLLRLLRSTYAEDWGRLRRDFDVEGAENWAELEQSGMLYLRPGGQGIRFLRSFLALLAERYYSLMRQILRAHDPRGLYLGDRYQSFFYPEVARAAAPHVDAISSNLNAHWNDGTFLRCYLDTLHALAGRPVIVSEFYAAARQNRSGNRNSHGFYPLTDTQQQRAAAFRTTITALARTPFVVGADWFQYFDEPRHGREDGENFNFGLVDLHDHPYEELTAAAAALDLDRLKSAPASVRPDASQGVPRAPRDPLGSFTPGEALRRWDRERGFVRPSSPLPLADLYACWDRQALYLGLYALDIVEDALYRSRAVPKADRAQWIVQLPGRAEPFHARLGAGREPISNDPSLRLTNLSGLNLNVRNIAALELPAALLGRKRLRAGDTVELACTFESHGQAQRVEWRGRFTLR